MAREVLRYLKFIERQREMEPMMESVVADTWEKLGPAPEEDYDKLQPRQRIEMAERIELRS